MPARAARSTLSCRLRAREVPGTRSLSAKALNNQQKAQLRCCSRCSSNSSLTLMECPGNQTTKRTSAWVSKRRTRPPTNPQRDPTTIKESTASSSWMALELCMLPNKVKKAAIDGVLHQSVTNSTQTSSRTIRKCTTSQSNAITRCRQGRWDHRLLAP